LPKRELDRVFNPRSVAVVGDKKANEYMWLKSLITFTGKLYSVQIDPRELPGIEEMGIPNYRSLLDIPESVDYVVIAVPRTVAPKIISDCIKKQVGGATLFTSGFAETNTEEGIRLERLVAKMAVEANFNLIGPNCMGIFNPKIGLRHGTTQYVGETGPVGFISQSGTQALLFSVAGKCHGVTVSKSVSYGNGAVLDSTDCLKYLASDEETKIVGMYIEGVKDGRGFFQCLRETAKRKPVVVWKGGKSEEGARAIASHTGSLTSVPVIWETVLRQCGAIKVNNLDEMIDCMKALLYLKPPKGPRVGLIAQSGGQSVVITDAFVQEGLTVPLLCERSYQEFASFFDIIGGSYINPLDVSWNFRSISDLLRILNILSRDDNVDALVLELWVDLLSRLVESDSTLDDLLWGLFDLKTRSSKSLLIVLTACQQETEALRIRRKLFERGLPSFPTFERAARALKRVTEYHRSHEGPCLKKQY
jgi:acyl-CoA synthetase (NDP forming)